MQPTRLISYFLTAGTASTVSTASNYGTALDDKAVRQSTWHLEMGVSYFLEANRPARRISFRTRRSASLHLRQRGINAQQRVAATSGASVCDRQSSATCSAICCAVNARGGRHLLRGSQSAKIQTQRPHWPSVRLRQEFVQPARRWWSSTEPSVGRLATFTAV